MTVVDTNVLLRYLLNDIQEQADKAAELIENGAKSYPEIIAEVVFDFVDCLLIARKQILNEEIFTFDKKLANRLK